MLYPITIIEDRDGQLTKLIERNCVLFISVFLIPGTVAGTQQEAQYAERMNE